MIAGGLIDRESARWRPRPMGDPHLSRADRRLGGGALK